MRDHGAGITKIGAMTSSVKGVNIMDHNGTMKKINETGGWDHLR